MIPEIKAKWIDALRSGQYEQGQRALKTPDGKFCCLGVLCDILAPGKWTATEQEDADGILLGTFDYTHWGDGEMPAYQIQEEAGIDKEVCTKLAVMNDDDGLNFGAIADWVESHL